MTPLNVLFAQAKAYATAIIVGAVLVLVIGAGIAFKVVLSQRNSARKNAADLQVVVNGYVSATKALQSRLDKASAAVAQEDADNKTLLADLQKGIPKNPEEATAWAIDAAKKISAEAK